MAAAIRPELRSLAVPIVDVSPKPGNARRHDLADLRDSLRRFGQVRPITVNRRTGHIVKGNGTWQAMRDEGATEIAVVWVDVDAPSETRMTVVDNRAHERGRMDDGLLLDLLQRQPDLEGTGYSEDDLDRLARSLQGPLLDDPPAPAEPRRRRDSEGEWRTLRLILHTEEHDQFVADVEALALPGENLALTVERLVREAA